MALLCLAGTIAGCSAPGGGTAVGPTGHFYIVGRDIVDPDGHRFYPIGANVSVRQGRYENGYTFNWNGTATGHAAEAQAWGWNIVRANLICVPPPSPTVGELNAGIDALIDEYTARKIVVMVECHDVTGKNPSADSAAARALQPFWDRLPSGGRTTPMCGSTSTTSRRAAVRPATSATG